MNPIMTIKQFRIKNFRSIKDETFEFENLSILIGKNNCGKSNVLDALHFLLESTARDFTEHEFWDPNQNIVLEATFANVDPFLVLSDEKKHRPKIEPLLSREGKLKVRRTVYNDHAKPPKLYLIHPETGDEKLTTGIDAAFKQFLPEVIHVETLADVADEAVGKSTKTLGKIVAQIANQIEDKVKPKIDEAFKEANELLNIVNGKDKRIEELKEIEAELTKYLRSAFSNASTLLRVRFPRALEIMENIDIDVFDGTTTPYFRKGHGLQRVLYLSLFRTLANLTRKSTEKPIKRPFLLLYEEPELFLHPHLQEVMRDTLEELSGFNQLIFTTHSPSVVSPKTLSQIIRLHQIETDAKEKLETKICGQKLEDEDFKSSRDLLGLLNLQRSSKLFFADKAILVEGISDTILVRAICTALNLQDPEIAGYSVVEVGSKDKFCIYKKLLEKMGIKIKIITDLDFLIRGAGSFCSEFNLSDINNHISRLCSTLSPLVQDIKGSNEEKTKEKRKKAKMKLMVEGTDSGVKTEKDAAIRKFRDHNVFVLSKGEIEDYVGLSKRTKSLYYEAAQEILNGEREVVHAEKLKSLLGSFLETIESKIK